jgi:hypothetical protein
VAFILEQSSDLEVWVSAAETMALVDETDNRDGTTTLVYQSVLPKDVSTVFLRMRVILN